MNIILVDDHVLFREGVASLLDAQPDINVLGQAASVAEAVALTRELHPDLILMDISLPDGNGLTATRKILAEFPDIKIVFLTVHEDDDRLFEAIKNGGTGYLLKNTRTQELLKMIENVRRGETAFTPHLAQRILAEFSRMRSQLSAFPLFEEDVALTKREIEVLKLVAKNASNKEIARELVISVSTVKNHMRNILTKLHLKDRREAAYYARRHGLVDPD